MTSIGDISKKISRFVFLLVVSVGLVVLVIGIKKDSQNLGNIVGPLVLVAFSTIVFLWSEFWMPFVFNYWKQKKAPVILTGNSSLVLILCRTIGIVISLIIGFILVSGLLGLNK